MPNVGDSGANSDCIDPVNKTREKLETRGVAPRHGFEPRFTAPKAAVLPLDDRGKLRRAAYKD
jgi:hypothetical protein